MDFSKIESQIRSGSEKGNKTYTFDESHNPDQPADFWFQESLEGPVLFVVFYSQACRWSRCLGCNLPALMSASHVPFERIINQIDFIITHPDVQERANAIRKVIVSNNGSVLDEATFSSTALMYLLAKLNLTFPGLEVLTLETRPEYVDFAELEFISRALKEGSKETALELAIGFEAFDEKIRNEVFDKGLSLPVFESLVRDVAPYGFRLKTYFMQKPVPGLSDEDAVSDIRMAIGYLANLIDSFNVPINMHLNPTYVARGTLLEKAFNKGEFIPPVLTDVARAALSAKGTSLTLFIGLSDEGLAVSGGSFIRPDDGPLIEHMEAFNRSQDFSMLEGITCF